MCVKLLTVDNYEAQRRKFQGVWCYLDHYLGIRTTTTRTCQALSCVLCPLCGVVLALSCGRVRSSGFFLFVTALCAVTW